MLNQHLVDLNKLAMKPNLNLEAVQVPGLVSYQESVPMLIRDEEHLAD